MTTAVQTAASAAAALFDSLNAARDAAGSSAVDPQDRFLKLLVTQLKNQDPLNPLDNQQMTSQLAQISTVDGINKLNTTLQGLIGSANDSQVMQAAALVGQGVLVSGSKLDLQSGSAIGGIDLSQAADKVTVTITDGSGLVVRTLDLGAADAGSLAFGWDGAADSGTAAAAGTYSFSVKATQAGESVSVAPLQFGTVSGVARAGSGALINIGSLGSFKLADIKQIL